MQLNETFVDGDELGVSVVEELDFVSYVHANRISTKSFTCLNLFKILV